VDVNQVGIEELSVHEKLRESFTCRNDAVGFGNDFDLDEPVFLVAFGGQVPRVDLGVGNKTSLAEELPVEAYDLLVAA
jgi:hypothetical protein